VTDDELLASADWLASRAQNGRWQTPWYSAVAVQALLAAGHQGPQLEQGRRYLESLDPHDAHEWSGKVHHAAQVLTALARLDPAHPKLAAWADCITGKLDGRVEPYVCGQAVHALLISTTTSPSDLSVVSSLQEYLERTPLSKASFLGYAPALLALAIAKRGDDPVVSEKAVELFSKIEDVSWYRDAEMTAWALITLHEVSSLTQVVIDKASFNDAFAAAHREHAEIPARERGERRKAAVYAVVLTLQVLGLIAVIVFNPTDSRLADTLLSLLILTPIAKVVKELWVRIG
jgi:hypothetical protein